MRMLMQTFTVAIHCDVPDDPETDIQDETLSHLNMQRVLEDGAQQALHEALANVPKAQKLNWQVTAYLAD